MAGMYTSVTHWYDDLIENYSDPRSINWPMVKSPVPTLCLVTVYAIFVKVIGPKLMANRKPFELKTAMIIYNALQAIICLTLFILFGYYGWFTRYSFICQPIDDHPDEATMMFLGWCFFLVRFLEFTDTIFFILRKKFNQVSTLHVVHHVLVPIVFWIGLTFSPSGQYTLAGFLNAFVHIFMYTYYMLAAMGPKYRKYTWWKKYMTTMQLVQFIIVIVHTVYTQFSSCNVPKMFGYVILFQATLFFVMFYSFYINSFPNKSATTGDSKKPTDAQTNEKVHDTMKNDQSNGTQSLRYRIHSN